MTARHLLRPAAGHDYCDLAPGRRTACERRRLGAYAVGCSGAETRLTSQRLAVLLCEASYRSSRPKLKIPEWSLFQLQMLRNAFVCLRLVRGSELNG